MLNLEKALRLANINNLCALVKAYVDSKISALSAALQEIFTEIDTALDGKGNCAILSFSNASVAVSAWASDATYSGYPFRAAISCSGVTASHIPSVVFGVSEATSGNFAPCAQTGANVVYIYAASKPSAAITIPTIECRKAVG